MKIEDLSLSDLKSAYDFILIEISDMKKKAKEKGINPDKISAYPELLEMENTLYHKLLNITRDLI